MGTTQATQQLRLACLPADASVFEDVCRPLNKKMTLIEARLDVAIHHRGEIFDSSGDDAESLPRLMWFVILQSVVEAYQYLEMWQRKKRKKTALTDV